MLLGPDVALQLEAALADPQLPCPCLTPETGLGGTLVFNTEDRAELTTSHGDFNETALLFICIAASKAWGHDISP